MADVGGALLSVVFDGLLKKMNREVLDFFRGRKLADGPLRKLKIALLSVKSVVEDAEDKELTKPAVKEWLDDLKDALYDAEDILDEIDTEIRTRELAAEFETTAIKVRNSVSAYFNPFFKEMKPKMEEVLDRLEYLAKQKDVLGLRPGVGGKSSERLPSTCLVEESGIFGRDDDKEKVVNLLLSDDAIAGAMSVIGIVGMGGIGKTTLAQLVYKDQRVNEHFDLKAWACVSQEFDVFRVTKTILEAVTSSNCDIKDLNLLQVTLKGKLMGKKFLLVLDDVWNRNYADWELLSRPFKSGAQGCRVIVTTRDDNVALAMWTTLPYHLNKLTEKDCWSLFAKYAFHDGNLDARPELEVIGRQIVKKCQGLPLATKTIGSLLRSKLDVGEWDKILKSEIWDLAIDTTNILPGLRLSYKYLPSHLKGCFAYCSIFPKNHAFEKDQVVLLWMAEGLLQGLKNKTMEEVGNDYFLDLVSRSLFQQSSDGKSCFVMHDLVNDIAKSVFGQFVFRLEANCSQKIVNKTHHLSYFRTRFDDFEKFKALNEAKRLRTFLPLEFSIMDNNLTKKVPHDLLSNLRCLRILSLSHYENVTNLPNSIGKIKQLRYLDLSFTSVKRLPDSMCQLINLQTLKLSCCNNLVGLPRDMRKLINLRHLDITGTGIMEMPIQLGRLKYLHTLTTFIIGKTSGSCIGELRKLTNLRGKLAIMNLQNVVSSMDALDACLKEKKHIKDLVLEWKDDNVVLRSQRSILDSLQPHSNLESLTIKYYSGNSFPDWVGHHSFSNIASLHLYGCKYCLSLPPLGQLPSLQDLSIIHFDEVVIVGREFYGNNSSMKPFRALKVLRFERALKWEQWFSLGAENENRAFPHLQELYIDNCPKLTGRLPIHFPSLAKLEIRECPLLGASLPRDPAICQLNLTCGEDLLKNLPAKIQVLKVGGFDALDSLAVGMMESNCSLQELEISNCTSLVSLQELPMHGIFSSLKTLYLINIYDSLSSFPLDLFPNLCDIYIFRWGNLESLTMSEQCEHDLMIVNIRIIDCPCFVSFPKGGLRAPNLTLLWVWNCGSLRSLPDKMHFFLPSLEDLQIVGCTKVELFPLGGLPSNLKSVSIVDCDNLVAGRMEWGLQKLPFLKSLFICGEKGDAKSFLEVGLLPPNLTALQIKNFPCLKSLDKSGFQHLASLEELRIDNCPMLKYMPEEGLPASISVLLINSCPLLKKQLHKKKGKEWFKIAHVHLIMIDDELIE
ncbi:putative disease resistance RPP13-like protein 1 [Corylus avellana]|uniref:putative disease resistance RPP13-like protein 1 n=1 Tax=Corylus avellana TaxID=13451 RepID=UPI00286C793F|nr:putative disease resistance RPP13-like protein 1 [Corylus avellana]XP_059435027.1 putative disease resistance RPP13-like protein 1 [Corylus avellana]XP_059435028.1 putative disease resistance RPP13-like protein 1 [Corylus avellana]